VFAICTHLSHADLSQDLQSVRGEGDLSWPEIHGARLALANPYWANRGEERTHSPSQKESNSETTVPLFTIEHLAGKRILPISRTASYPARKQGKTWCLSRVENEAQRRRVRSTATVYKSLAGGFRCACEVWRRESAEGSNQCDSAAEQGVNIV